MKSPKPVLGLTMGDPAGIGPELCFRALQHPSVLDRCTPVLFGDAGLLRRMPGSISNQLKLRHYSIGKMAPCHRC